MGINANSLQKLYVAYFNRPADPAGLAYWEKLLDDKKATLDDVAKSFAADKEYVATFKDLTQNQIVNKIYMNLFGHGADNDGLLYWVGRLNATEARDKLTIDQVVVNISAGARNDDLKAFEAKVAASEAFTDKVSKTPGGVAAYTGDVANAIAKAFITSVTDAATLAAATAPAKLTAVVESVQGAADPLLKASNDAAAAFNAANTTVAQKVADAATAAAKVTTDDAAEDAAIAKAELTDAAALQVVTEEAAAKATAAATAKTDAIAAVAAATKERDDALKAGDEAAYNAAKAKLAAANDKLDFATANATQTASDAAAAKAKSDAAVADDAAAVKAGETLTKSIADAATAATAASTAATAAADAAAKFSAAAKATAQNSDDVAAAAAVTSATKAVADAANAQGVVTVINSTTAYANAAATAATAATAAADAHTAAAGKITAANSVATANDAIAAAAAEVTAATAAKTAADAALVVATAYDAAAKATTVTTDDKAAADALSAAKAAVEVAANAVTAAAAAKTAAAALPANFVAQSINLTSGVDKVAGAAGDDVFNATLGNVVSSGVLVQAGTLTGLDAIDGKAGVNTLNIADQAGSTALPGSLNVTNVQTVNASSVGAATLDFTTGFTGLTAVNVTASTGADVVKVGATTAASVTNSAGSVTLTGGLTQTVNTAGGYTISGGKGAINVTDTAQGNVASTINGGTSVNLTTTTNSNGNITVGTTSAPTGAITIVENLNGTGALTGGTIVVKGGTTVNVTVNATQATANTTTTIGSVNVLGTATTTAVNVTETKSVAAGAKVAGIANGNISVTDVNYATTTAGTIASVSANGFNALSFEGSALTTLNVANGSSNILINNSDAVAARVTTLNVTANGLTGGTLDDADVYKTLNVTTTGTDSKLANITFGAATALTVAGTAGLTLNSAAGLAALKTITVTGAAGLTANSGIAGTVTSIDASASSGKNSVTLNPSVATYKGGSGVDIVTISTAAPTKSITGGAGAADELVLNLAAGTLANPSGNAFIGGFETLGFGAAADGTYNGTGFTTVHFGSAPVFGAVTVTALAAGTNLLVDAAPGQDISYVLGDASGTADSVNVTIGAAAVASTVLAGNNINLAGIETIKLTALGDGTGTDTVKFVDTAAKALTISGGSAVTVTLAGATALASVDASAATKLVDVTAVALGTAGATVKSGVGGLKAAAGVGADTFDLTASAAAADIITIGDGNAKPVSLDVIKGFSVFATKTTAGDLSDKIDFTATPTVLADVATAANIPAPTDSANAIPTNVNYTAKSGIVTFGGSGLASATLSQLIGAAESIVDNAGLGKVVAFQFGTDTYVVHASDAALTLGTAGDSVVQLVGVSGLTALDATGTAAANTLLIG